MTAPDAPTLISLVDEPIDVQAVYAALTHPTCGAVNLFVGTTRDHHERRPVAELAYEAYRPMALQELQALADEARQRFPEVVGIALVHRLGQVPVAEASVVAGVSSAHRGVAFEASEWVMNTLKARVPIWKKESYRDGGAPQWVANKEALSKTKEPRS